ncbi:MAG TPA: AI-2E family transporter [Candidatus Brocadiia bacterium]|nr:AI-2E family transporter [Candidatus Brocadiia bacterium]
MTQESRDELLFDLSKRRNKIILAIVLLFLFIALCTYLKSALTPVLVGITIAYVFEPIVNWITRRNIKRFYAVCLVYLMIFLVCAAGLAVTIPIVYTEIRQAVELAERKQNGEEGILEKLRAFIVALEEESGQARTVEGAPPKQEDAAPAPDASVQEQPAIPPLPEPETVPAQEPQKKDPALAQKLARLWKRMPNSIRGNTDDLAKNGVNAAKWIAQNVVVGIGTVISLVFAVSLTFVYSFFFMLGMQRMKSGAAEYIPGRHKEQLLRVFRNIDRSIASFVRGRLLICCITGILTSIGLFLCDVRFALLLGFGTGFTALIPIAGVIITFIPSALIAYFDHSGNVWYAVGVLAVFVSTQTFENLVLNPLLLAKEVDLHPVTILLAFTIGAKLLGAIGVIVAIPIACAIKIIFYEFIDPHLKYLAQEKPWEMDVNTEIFIDGKNLPASPFSGEQNRAGITDGGKKKEGGGADGKRG